MDILVTGGRGIDLQRQPQIRKVMVDAVDPGLRLVPHTVHHGDADGLDRIAKRAAWALGWIPVAWPARWEAPCYPGLCQAGHRQRRGTREWCPAAGAYRNGAMVREIHGIHGAGGSVAVLAFPTSASKGTWDCVERALKALLPVDIWMVPDCLSEPLRRATPHDIPKRIHQWLPSKTEVPHDALF